jgi:glycosyltransferase involved in cell wall biosynthesis
LLFFGFIRPYKGLDVLLDAVAALGRDDIYLTVVGEHWGDSTQLRVSVANVPNIELHLRYMDDAEAAEYFARADFVVLPYLSATGSAVASVALHYNKPVIASATGGLIDVIIDGQTGMLVPPGDAPALAAAIASVDRTSALAMSTHVAAFKQSFGWASLCKQLMSLVDPTTSLDKAAIPYDSDAAPITTRSGSTLEP